MNSTFGPRPILVSAVIPTCNRQRVLKNTLTSISQQNVQPFEIIIIDASDNDFTQTLCKTGIDGLISELKWFKADEKGAAVQRNKGTMLAVCQFILYMDDDILLEDNCLSNLWNCIQHDHEIAGVNAIITNQKYLTPGKISRFMYRLMSGVKLESYAGKCIGPAWNLAPEDNDLLPDYTRVEWLNTGCTIYRRDALPEPVFPVFFIGYSIMEDLYLSLIVAKKWELYNVRTAKIFHDTQPGDHKNSIYKVSKMQLVNRHYIMRNVMEKKSFKDYCKLFLLELFMVMSRIKNIRKMIPYAIGKIGGTLEIIKNG